MEAFDLFGSEPDSDEITETPSMAELAIPHDLDNQVNAGMFRKASNQATDKQINYILSLIDKKELPTYFKQKQLIERIEAEAVEKAEASQVIAQLLEFKDKPAAVGNLTLDKPSIKELPAGRYAITNELNELRFYQVWRGTKYGKPDLIKVYIQHGPDDSEIPFRSAMVVCKRIVAAGALECAQRYGREIGSCYRCGRRLTHRLSRQLGIGPICGNRDFGEQFKNLESIARAEIEKTGHDPDEVIEIDSEK